MKTFALLTLLTFNITCDAILEIKMMYMHCGAPPPPPPVVVDDSTVPDFPFERAAEEIALVLDNFGTTNNLFYPQDSFNIIDTLYMKNLRKITKLYIKGIEKGLKDFATLEAEKIYQKHFIDTFIPVIQTKTDADTVLDVMQDFVKLSIKLFNTRSKVVGSLGKLHLKALDLIFEDCAANSDCEIS